MAWDKETTLSPFIIIPWASKYLCGSDTRYPLEISLCKCLRVLCGAVKRFRFVNPPLHNNIIISSPRTQLPPSATLSTNPSRGKWVHFHHIRNSLMALRVLSVMTFSRGAVWVHSHKLSWWTKVTSSAD